MKAEPGRLLRLWPFVPGSLLLGVTLLSSGCGDDSPTPPTLSPACQLVSLENAKTMDTHLEWNPVFGNQLLYTHTALTLAEAESLGYHCVFILDTATEERRVLARARYASWMPDGRSAVISDDELWRIDTETGARIAVGVRGTDPHSHPIDDRILYRSTGPGDSGAGLWLWHEDRQVSGYLLPSGRRGRWSPDGTRILATRSGVVLFSITNPDSIIRLAERGLGLGWHPDGQHILFVDSSVKIMDVDSRETRTLVHNATEAALSHDGRRLAFLADGGDGTTSLFVSNQDGSNCTRLTMPSDYWAASLEPYEDCNWRPYQFRADMDYEPDWHPTENKFLYTHEARFSDEMRGSGIWEFDLDTGERTFLASGYQASWAPDGTRVVFRGFTSPSRIFILDVTDGSISEVPGKEGRRTYPDWHPRTNQIIYAGRVDGEPQGIRLFDLDTGVDRYLRWGTQPKWSPDGSLVAAGTGLFVFSVDNPDSIIWQQDYEADPRPVYTLAWMPDGNRIAAHKSRHSDVGFSAIWAVEYGKGNETALVQDGWDIAFSPDGKQMVFSAVEERDGEATYTVLFLSNTDGSGCRQLTTPDEYRAPSGDSRQWESWTGQAG